MTTNWFQQYRMEWIKEISEVYGFINRKHLMRKFGLSKPQASNDLRNFIFINPTWLKYDSSRKTYMRNK